MKDKVMVLVGWTVTGKQNTNRLVEFLESQNFKPGEQI